MKLTKSKLKQLIKEVFEGDEEPGITIDPGNVQRIPTHDPVEDIIDGYSDRSVKPELIKRMLEVIREFGDVLPLDEHDLNLIEDAAREMKKHLVDGEEDAEENYEPKYFTDQDFSRPGESALPPGHKEN